MSKNLFLANETPQSKQKSKTVRLCHICDLNWRSGGQNSVTSLAEQSADPLHPMWAVSPKLPATVGQSHPSSPHNQWGCISRTRHSQSRIPLEKREMQSSITWPTSATPSHLRGLNEDTHPRHWQPLQPALLTESFLQGPLSKWPVIELYKAALILWAKMRLIFELRGLLLSTVHYKTNTKYFINRSPYSVLEKQCIFHAP